MTSLAPAIVLTLFLLGGQEAERAGVSSQVGLPLVMGVLTKAHASGSLAYRGRCDAGPGKRFDFPKLQSPQKVSDDPVAALRQIFADDQEMRVTRDANGFIRMVEADVPHDLLDVRVRRIAFKDDEDYPPKDVRYFPRDAMWAILSKPEVSAFMRDHQIVRRFDIEDASGRRPTPSPVIPHLPNSLYDVALSEALDNVLRTFPGLWIYENCPSKDGKRVVDFGIYANDPMWSVSSRHDGP
jgi:hypothetical protein